MRTTLDIDNALLRQMEERATREGQTLDEVTNDLLRQGLVHARSTGGYHLGLLGWNAELQPDLDIQDRGSLFDRMK